jgi:hypothetical protein
MRFSLIAAAVFAVVSCGGAMRASDIYVAQNAVGANNGTGCSNAHAISWANSSINWGIGSGQIGPGTTVHLCGTVTGAAGSTAFAFHGSGTSASHITLKFESGAQLNAPYWSSKGAINCSNQSYTTVDGGTNGLIQNTANGTRLANHQTSTGFYGSNCTNSEVKNLTVQNIYVNQGSTSSATDTAGANTADILFIGNSTNSKVDYNKVSQAKTGIQFAMDPNGDASNCQIFNNSVSDMDWGINIGGGDTGDTSRGCAIHNNTITNWTNWQFPTSAYHQDGIMLFNYASGSATLQVNVYDNYIHGDLGVGSPTGFVYCAQNVSCMLFNNLLINTGHVIYGIAWLDTHLGGDKAYNNVIVGNNSNDFAFTLGTSTATNVNSKDVIENNIVIGVGVGIHDYSTLTSDISISNHNVWRNSSGGPVQMATNDSSYMTFASWQQHGFDANSTSANPNLNGSFHVGAGSSAINLGANLESLGVSALDQDMALSPRPATGAWTAGAYNYSSSTSVLNPPTTLTASVQ